MTTEQLTRELTIYRAALERIESTWGAAGDIARAALLNGRTVVYGPKSFSRAEIGPGAVEANMALAGVA